MSLLNRISSGLVFIDDFDSPTLNTSVWQASPTDGSRYSLTERSGYLRLKHGDPDLFILMTAPRYDFVMEVDTDYQPVRPTDQGGVVAYLDKDNYVEMLEYFDSVTGITQAYDRLRLIKRSDLYEGYGSNDNGKTWDLIGTAFMSAPKIGMVLHGINETSSDVLDIDAVRIYRDTKIHVGNLNPGQVVKLFSDTGLLLGEAVCADDSDHAKIEGQNLNYPFDGTVEIYDKTGFLLDSTGVVKDIWGGDVFWYGIQLNFELDGLLLKQDREHQLGNMQGGVIERRAFIINSNDIPVNNITASIAALGSYLGWEWANIAEDSFGEPGVYGGSINIGTMQPGDRIPVWLKVTRRASQQIASLHDYKFIVVFESG